MASYGNKYKVSFRELHTSELWETYIQERSYTGTCTDVIGTGIPCVTEYRPENDNDYDWIRPSVCTVGMISSSDQQFIEFFTSDNRKYKIKVYRSSVLQWTGWLIPDTYKEPYEPATYEISISATDGLLYLKDIEWKASNDEEAIKASYYGKKSLMRGIEGCLNKLDLPDVSIWDASYIYEQNHDQTDNDSPLTQTYFNTDVFYDESGLATNCYIVLLEILKAINCQIWQGVGCWNIVPQNAQKTSYVRRKYNWQDVGYYKITTVVSSETYNPAVVFDDSAIKLYATPELSFRPGWKELKLLHDYGFHANLMENSFPYFTTGFNGGIDEKGNVIHKNHYLAPNNGVGQYIAYNLGNITADTIQRLKVSFKGTGDLSPHIQIYIDSSPDYYLDGDGHWHPDLNTYTYQDSWNAISVRSPIVTDVIPVTGVLRVKVLADFTSLRPDPLAPRNYIQCSYHLSDFKIELLTELVFYESKEITTEINDDNFFSPETIEVTFGDCPADETMWIQKMDSNGLLISRTLNPSPQDTTNASLVYRGVLYWLDGSTYKLTTLWTVKGRDQYNRLLNVIADEISVNHLDPQWVINANLYGVIDYGSIITIDTKRYMILRASHNCYDKEWELELFEIADTEQGYLRLRTGGYVKLRTGDKIKVG